MHDEVIGKNRYGTHVMVTTTAILEFLVIGSLWVAFILALLVLLCLYTPSILPFAISDDLRVTLSLISIPVAYLLGVIAQGVTWRFWYLPRYHTPALAAELGGPHGRAYQAIYSAMRRRRYPMASLAGAGEALTDGKQLGFILDLLRVELLHGERVEMANQYQIQFHLYRLLYGSIPALVALSLLFLAGAVLDIFLGNLRFVGVFLSGMVICILVAVLALPAATHRRRRLWKYLRLCANIILAGDLADVLDRHELESANQVRSAGDNDL